MERTASCRPPIEKGLVVLGPASGFRLRRWLLRCGGFKCGKDFSANHSFPAGTEILSINGVSAQAILSKLLTVARADGSNDSKRIAKLAVTGDGEYETFDIYHPMFFPFPGKQFAFAIRLPGSNRSTHVAAEALTFERRIAPIKQREDERKGGSDVLFEAKSLADGSFYIKMPTWALYDSKWEWNHWLNEKVDSPAESHAPAMILDIRGNEDGDDVGNEILTNLIDEPINSLSQAASGTRSQGSR